MMDIPARNQQEETLEYAERLAGLYAKKYDGIIRKSKGQFFTPDQVSEFMVNLFEIHNETIHLLDPGSGTGILTAAFCHRILNNHKPIRLTIDVYENDSKILPFLEMTLQTCKQELGEKGHNIKYNIYEQDFILHNGRSFRELDLFWSDENQTLYDFVISNPPYFKISKDSPQSNIMSKLISGQPNIYALFMAISARMLKPEGEMVFITPRSFCSGLYYKKFREWFLSNIQITHIHTFESRKDIFDVDEVLQENIIIKAKKLKKLNRKKKITISTSKNKSFNEFKEIEVESNDVIRRHKNGETFVTIPTSSLEIDIVHTVDKWPNSLRNLGLEISTGPVVPFRAIKYLRPELTENSESVPLLWMHNLQNDMTTVYPLKKNNKPLAIYVCNKTKPLLLPVKNYVLLKRFTSKEQKRRLYAAVLLECAFPYKAIGIENHVNYIYEQNGNLSVHEAYGIAALLGTTFIDNYFRSLNGNTQVNATDIRSLPLPKTEDIIKIGKLVYESPSFQKGIDLDDAVAAILGISDEIIKKLNKRKVENE